jgi:monoamine oxidase
MADDESTAAFTRRAFLTAAVAGATATLAGRTWAASARGVVSPPRAVIVGAGLAGLTTALDLRDAGWDVVVLEARDRVGGRVHTLYDAFSSGLHAEAGGESIDDNHDRLLAMVARFGLTTELRPPDKLLQSVVFRRRHRGPLLDLLGLRDGAVLRDYFRFDDAVAEVAAGVDPEHPERAANAIALDQLSLDTFIRRQHLVPEADFLVRLEHRAGFNAEPSEVSMLFVAQQAAVVADIGDAGAETMRIAGGNSRLVEAMAADLGDRVLLGAAVTRVEHDAGGVRVIAGPHTVDADHLVLAVPMPPVRRITFAPALPAALAATIAGLDLGPAAKVITEYDARFWEADGVPGFTVTDLPFHVAWAPTDSYTSTGGLLTQFITGRPARTAARMTDVRRIGTFQRQLDRVYPEGVPHRTARAATMAWANEPYTGGGYAVFGPGQMVPFWPALRDGVGRIRFAGEHTESLAGYMESAVRSGHRVAAALLSE